MNPLRIWENSLSPEKVVPMCKHLGNEKKCLVPKPQIYEPNEAQSKWMWFISVEQNQQWPVFSGPWTNIKYHCFWKPHQKSYKIRMLHALRKHCKFFLIDKQKAKVIRVILFTKVHGLPHSVEETVWSLWDTVNPDTTSRPPCLFIPPYSPSIFTNYIGKDLTVASKRLNKKFKDNMYMC